MKLTNETLDKILQIVNTTPEELRDYCYRDGGVTEWYRGNVIHRQRGDELPYFCCECGTKRHYHLTKLEEMKKEMEW